MGQSAVGKIQTQAGRSRPFDIWSPAHPSEPNQRLLALYFEL